MDGVCFSDDSENCGDAIWCFDHNHCDKDGLECQQNCINQLYLELQMALAQYFTCLTNSGCEGCWDSCALDCPDEECYPESRSCLLQKSEKCLDEFFECFPPGDLSCLDTYLCLASCPEGETGQECVGTCFGWLSKEGYLTWLELSDCLEAHGCIDPLGDDDLCGEDAWEACQSEFQSCAHGELTCKEIRKCLEMCQPEEVGCDDWCILNGTVEAQGQFQGLADCLAGMCPEPADPECEALALDGACSAPYDKCTGGG
jgi:hypothetical protein